MRNHKSFFIRMQEHLKNNHFSNFPQEDIWGRRVEYDLDQQEIRFVSEEDDYLFEQLSPFTLGDRLYHFHHASIGFSYTPNHPLNLIGKWDEQWFKRLKRVQKFKDLVYKQGVHSEFEELFLKNYTYFNQLAQIALFYLEDHHYHDHVQEATGFGVIGYRSFSWDDVEEGDHSITFIHPEQWVLDIPARDLGQFIQNSSMETLMLDDSMEMLKGYQQNRMLTLPEHSLIYARILYPSKWIRLIEKYFNRQDHPDMEWEEEMREMNQHYQEWESVLASYPTIIFDHFDVKMDKVSWL